VERPLNQSSLNFSDVSEAILTALERDVNTICESLLRGKGLSSHLALKTVLHNVV
jgi:hypothetical protein